MKSTLDHYIFIDPSTQKVEKRCGRLNGEAMLGIIGCQSLEAIILLSGDLVWFDGEPVPYQTVLDGIEIEATPILGSRCMITGPVDPRTGMPTSCRVTAKDASITIRWMPRRKIIGETLQWTPAGFEIDYVFDQA